ncbi:MAG TPA: sialate O-acetylesterase [Candidatus Solibacter sp.]|nr:sialate O-acetylesterase [Candidatus Solibacter sp.]
MKRMTNVFRTLFFAILLAALSASTFADPTLPTFISDHMVVQQGLPIHIWGNADPREKISVLLVGNSAETTSDSAGRWSIHLPAMTAGGPFTLTVRGKKEIVIRDVMIGEVWVASGQSNMAFSLEGSQGAAQEIPNASQPQIRLFNVPKRIAVSPQANTLPAQWELCTPESAKSFSAVAYYFAKEIQRKLNMPVGIIESVWPGTAIEEWISPAALKADKDFASLFDEWNRATSAEKMYAEKPAEFDLQFDDFEFIPTSATGVSKVLANFDDGSSRLSTGGSFNYSWGDTAGSLFELASAGRGAHGFAAKVSGQLDGTQDAILAANYKLNGSPIDLTDYSGIRFWVRGTGSFRFRSKQPTITDYDDYGSPMIKATSEWQPVTILFRDLRQDGWGVVEPFTQNALTGFSIENLTPLGYAPMPISALYEGMIAPLLPYAFRGALWYQGESNALRAHQYSKLLPTLIQNWRDDTHQPDMEFLTVQLPNHGAIPEQPGDSAWAELREAQLMTLKSVPHTGLAVTIDVGDPKDLHPHRKREVGERLALWALGTTYKEPIEYSGPIYESMRVVGNEVRLRFSHVGAGLEAHGDPVLRGFAIAGADRKFRWADARIDGDSVVVSSPDVPQPVAVRYAWGDSPICNLFNKDGVPASPFRTDDWPGITGGH